MTAEFSWALALAFAAATGGGVFLAMGPAIAWLKRRAVWDIPNARSSHSEKTPRGGGIVVSTAVILASAIWFTLCPDEAAALVLVGAAALALISWIDDRRPGGLPAWFRLGAQALAVFAVLAFLPEEQRIAEAWLPLWLERLLCFLAWLWFTNLFNFMDGINGIAGLETVSIGIGTAVVQFLAGPAPIAGLALILAGGGLGFLPWNWNRSKVFLGDVGSVPLGFLLGWLLLGLSMTGQWAIALILPMFYWMDATVTLIRRLWRGEKVWQAHRSHFYQQGTDKLGSHVAVTWRIAALNVLLIGLAAVAASGWPQDVLGVLTAAIAAALLCRHFAMTAKRVE